MLRKSLYYAKRGIAKRTYYSIPPNNEPDYMMYGLYAFGFIYLYDKYHKK